MIKPIPKNKDGELLRDTLTDETFLCIRRKGLIHGLYLRGDRLIRVSADGEALSVKGMICIAKVIDVVPNINAIFVRLPNKTKCFIPMNDVLPECVLSDREVPVQGDNLLVQVTKDPAKGKEASGTTVIKLEGRYCVVVPGKGEVLYSHKISASQREQMKGIERELKSFLSPNMNIILRTKAAGVEEAICVDECKALLDEMKEHLGRALNRTEYSVLKKPMMQYQELLSELLAQKKQIRILAEDAELYDELLQFVRSKFPDCEKMCKHYQDNMGSLSALFGIESRLKDAISDKVWLKSGAFLYIEPTQAMTVIDVNSGKFDRRGEAEETFLHVNLEAAEEIVHQIILRNLSGIIVIDFINMKNHENYSRLWDKMIELLQKSGDFARLIDITKLGLVEMTRKKTGKTIYEQILM